MTIEEMDAEIARLKAFLRKARQDSITEMTEALKTERNPYLRERFIKYIEKERKALLIGTYD